MRHLIIILLLLISWPILAQEDTENGNFNNWFFLHPQLSSSKNWTFATEVHIRRDQWVTNWRDLLIRPYAVYRFSPKADLAAGYTYIRSWGVAPTFAPGPSNEHNIWEQISLHQKFNKVKLSHRYRLEHRFRDQLEADGEDWVKTGTSFSNRFRYRLTFRAPIVDIKENQQLFLHLFDELWINQYDYLLFKNFARNWIYLGLGYQFDKRWTLELGYMHQYDNGVPNVNTHLLQLALSYHIKTFTQE